MTMKLEALHPIGCARLIQQVLIFGLCGVGQCGIQPNNLRHRADGLRNITRNGLIKHYCDVYPVDEGKLVKACLRKALELENEAARLSRLITPQR